VAHIWKEIEKEFSGMSKNMKVCRILCEMRYVKQVKKNL
jgi:hypothetical protein